MNCRSPSSPLQKALNTSSTVPLMNDITWMPVASILCFIDLAIAPQIRTSTCNVLNCVVLAIIAFCKQGVRERIGLLPDPCSIITSSSAASKTVETRSPNTGMAILIGQTSNLVIYMNHARKRWEWKKHKYVIHYKKIRFIAGRDSDGDGRISANRMAKTGCNYATLRSGLCFIGNVNAECFDFPEESTFMNAKFTCCLFPIPGISAQGIGEKDRFDLLDRRHIQCGPS